MSTNKNLKMCHSGWLSLRILNWRLSITCKLEQRRNFTCTASQSHYQKLNRKQEITLDSYEIKRDFEETEISVDRAKRSRRHAEKHSFRKESRK